MTMHFTDEKSKKIHRGCLEAEGEKISVTLAGDVSCDVCVNFTHQGLAWGRVRRCFELVAHVNGVMIFSDRRQWSKVSRSLPKEGKAAVQYYSLQRGQEPTDVILNENRNTKRD